MRTIARASSFVAALTLILSGSLAPAQPLLGRMPTTTNAREALAAAAVLLAPTDRPTVPVVVLDPKTASRVQVNMSRGACAYVVLPRRNVIMVRLDCSPLVTVIQTDDHVALCAVAALLAHEQAHIVGADETEARAREVKVFETLTSPLTPEARKRALEWFAVLASRGRA